LVDHAKLPHLARAIFRAGKTFIRTAQPPLVSVYCREA
jgi:hypothetical protein